MTVDRWLEGHPGRFWCRTCARPVVPHWKIVRDPHGTPAGLLAYHLHGGSIHAVAPCGDSNPAPPGQAATVN